MELSEKIQKKNQKIQQLVDLLYCRYPYQDYEIYMLKKHDRISCFIYKRVPDGLSFEGRYKLRFFF